MAEMTDERWNAIKTKIDLWFNNHQDWESEHIELISVPNLVSAGDNKPAKRVALYSAIRTCFSDIADKPFTTGKKSAMPEEIQSFRDGQLELLKKALMTAWDNSPQMQQLLVRNKRSGGGFFTSAEDYAQSVVDSTRLRMNTAYNAYLKSDDKADYIWSGEDKTSDEFRIGMVCQINKE